MIIVSENTVPVACYDDVSPQEALKAYVEDILAAANIFFIIVNSDGTASLSCHGKKYNAFIYLEDF